MHRIKYIKNRLLQEAIVLFVLDVAFFGNINTNKVAQFVLIIGFVLLVSSLYVAIYGAISLIKLYGVPVRRKKRLSIYAAAFFGLIIALQSMGELSPKDVIVVCMMAVVGYCYINYAKANEQKIN